MIEINPKAFFQKSAITLLAICLLNIPVLGQYEISWSTIDGGGGTSSGGDFVLSGTIGQPDAGVMAGGSYVLSGGFWPGSKWCFVDLPDLFNFLQDWLKTGAGCAGDLNDDNSVDLVDYNIITTHWLRLCPDSWPWW